VPASICLSLLDFFTGQKIRKINEGKVFEKKKNVRGFFVSSIERIEMRFSQFVVVVVRVPTINLAMPDFGKKYIVWIIGYTNL